MSGWGKLILHRKRDLALSNLLTEILKFSIATLLTAYLYFLQDYPYVWLIPLSLVIGYHIGKWRYTRKPKLHFLPKTFPEYRPAYVSEISCAGMLWHVWLSKRDPLRDNLDRHRGLPAERIIPKVGGHPVCPCCRTELEETPFLWLHIFQCPQEDCNFRVYRMRASHQLYHAAEKVAIRKFQDGSLSWRVP